MAKILKETPVHIACPACGRPQRAKLRWAQNHKSLKCKDCKESIDLRANPAKSAIDRTEKALANFERVLKALRFEAKRAKKKSKKAKKARRAVPRPSAKAAKPAATKKPQTATMLPASPAPGSQPQA